VSLVTAGPQTLTATDTGNTSITGTSRVVMVSPTAATQFSVSAPATVVAGTPFNVTVSALDQFGNVATSYTGPLHFLSTDPAVPLPPDYNFVASDNGVHTFAVTLTTAETLTLGVEDADPPTLVGTSNPITVQAAAAHTFLVSAPSTATAGQPIQVTVTAQDAFGNVVTNYAGTVHFSLSNSDSMATLPLDYPFVNSDQGSHTFNVTLTKAQTQMVQVAQTGSGTPVNGTSNPIAVSATDATTFQISAPPTAVLGVPVNVTVTARDPFGNVDANYAGTVSFTSTDGGASLPDDHPFVPDDQGSFTSQVTFSTAGPQTVTATGGSALGTVITATSGPVVVS
jgi:S-adenosylmethionine hydrolase